MRVNPRTPPTSAVAEGRRFAARSRVLLALSGLALVAIWPGLTPRPLAAALGFVVIGLTGLMHGRGVADRWLRVEEALSCTAGFLIVTLGGGEVTSLTLVWLTSAAVGVLARGGRVGAVGRVLIVAILASPIAIHGIDGDTVGLLIGGVALLMATGRVSLEISELLSDSLTGLLSRAAFDAEVDRRVGRGGPLALIMIDLDDFGLVNKAEGHRAGDIRLAGAAEIMGESVRAEDVVGRVGGDEFAVLTSSDQPEEAALRIVESMTAAGYPASAGVASCPADGDEAGGLLAAADAALRTSKQEGKLRVTRFARPPEAPPGPETEERGILSSR